MKNQPLKKYHYGISLILLYAFYLPILLAKLAVHRQHGRSWIICPSSDMHTMRQLSNTDGIADESHSPLPDLELVAASDTDCVEELLAKTDVLLIYTDNVY